MDVNFNSQLGTSIPLADIVETGYRYIKLSNGIAIVYWTMPGIVAGSHKISTGIYEWRMTPRSPITFTSVLYFIASIDVDVYMKSSSENYTITKNGTTTKYNTTDNRDFDIAPIIDISSYVLNNNYTCSFNPEVYVNIFIIGKWK